MKMPCDGHCGRIIRVYRLGLQVRVRWLCRACFGERR
jgi:hypothetical protein